MINLMEIWFGAHAIISSTQTVNTNAHASFHPVKSDLMSNIIRCISINCLFGCKYVST